MQTETRFCLTQPVVLQKAGADSTVRAFRGSALTTQVGESLLCSLLFSDLSRKPLSLCGYLGVLDRGWGRASPW